MSFEDEESRIMVDWVMQEDHISLWDYYQRYPEIVMEWRMEALLSNQKENSK